MDLEDLQTFVEIAGAGGVSPAARRLGLSKSIVSRRLARLEVELGIQLVARTTRGAGLTEAGITFREHAARVVSEMAAAHEAIFPDGNLRGVLRISAPLSVGPTHLAPVLIELARRHPDLHVHSSYTDRFVDIVAEGFDCAVRIGHLPDSTLSVRRVGPIRTRLVASPAYLHEHGSPENFDDLAKHEALLQGVEVWQFVDGNDRTQFRPHGRFKADSGLTLLTAALAGLGIAALPDFLTGSHWAAGNLIQVMPGYTLVEAGLFVVRPPGLLPSRKVRTFTDMLIEHFQRDQENC